MKIIIEVDKYSNKEISELIEYLESSFWKYEVITKEGVTNEL